MPIDANMPIDYRQPEVWNRLARLFDSGCEPRPTANCGRIECAPGWEWRPRLSDYDLWLAVRGRGSMRIGAASYPIVPGALFMLRPGDTGWATQEPNDRLTVVYLHFDFFTIATHTPFTPHPGDLPSQQVVFSDFVQIEALLTHVMRLIERHTAFAALEAKLLLQQIMLLIYQQDAANQGLGAARRDRRVERVMTTIRSHPEQRFSLDQAAALVDLAPGYFSRLFTRETGMSLRAFVLRARLERARFLLEETTLPIGQIAAQLGYDDLFLFSRQFKQHVGVSPRQARRGRSP